jgi:uncharacterized protein
MENMDSNRMQHHLWFKVLILLSVVAIVLVSVVMALRRNDINYQFSVSATGKVTAVPDIASVTVGVYTEAKATAADAVKENTEVMNEIISSLKGIDIEKKDITTSNYALSPVYDWTDKEGKELLGYEVRQNITIKIRDLDNIGKTIQVTTEKGANQIGGVSFTIDDPEELQAEAVSIAIEKAKAKAEHLVDESGIKIGKIINIYQNQPYGMDYRVNKAYSEVDAIGMDAGMIEPSIEVGEQEVVVEVTLVYEVK